MEPEVDERHGESHDFMRSVSSFLRLIRETEQKPSTSPGTTGAPSAGTGKSHEVATQRPRWNGYRWRASARPSVLGAGRELERVHRAGVDI